ncbi:MAG: exo-alpha-sialidase [Bacteroidia bacterium]|nr:exo-alpha-sialidase [Bacteroidia bacterium]
MKRFLPLLVIALLLLTGCPPKPQKGLLSPPIVDPELYGCATAVTVSGFVPGAVIDIYANGNIHLGGGPSDAPYGQSFKVSPALVVGQVITATQTFGGIVSDFSAPVTVKSYREDHPEGYGKPKLNKPIYNCGGAISVSNLAKGGLVKVFADGVQVGSVDGCGVGQWVSVSPDFATNQKISATVTLCNKESPSSDTVVVIKEPNSLPTLQIKEIYENGTTCSISNIINGAEVTVFNGQTQISQDKYPGGAQIVRLNPAVHAGDEITAIQKLCNTVSDTSPPSVVLPCSALPAPVLGQICPGDKSVKISGTVPEAHIQVYRDGVLAADGGGNEVVLFYPAALGENFSATQSLGTCVSKPSVALAVGCGKTEMLPPLIHNGGRAVAVAVNPLDDHQIVVASETGGLFRSLDRGKYWTQVTGNATFRFTDVTYLPFAPGVILATASKDSRKISGGGIWRSTDDGDTWKRIQVSTPSPNCKKTISGYALSVDRKSKRVWAGTSCGLASSEDNGATWKYLDASQSNGYNNEKIYAVQSPHPDTLVVVTPSGVMVSGDGGQNFTLSLNGIPEDRKSGLHNQLAISPRDFNHIYWAFNYKHGGEEDGYHTLYQSVDFGENWKEVYSIKDRPNRPPFVRISYDIKGDAQKYEVYWGDGATVFRRGRVSKGANGKFSLEEIMVSDHGDVQDVGFAQDSTAPLLLLSDGGLHKTTDGGALWEMTGSGTFGYNALQITEVTGQFHENDSEADLYFGTQDNFIWASSDYGKTWPEHKGGEGFYLNVMRDFYPSDVTRVTARSCGNCKNVISKPIFSDYKKFNNPQDSVGYPKLLKPGYYIQNSIPKGTQKNSFQLTSDNGDNWKINHEYLEKPRDLPKVVGALDNPVLYTAATFPGTTPENQELIQIKKITQVLGPGTPIVSDITGFGSLGAFKTEFAVYKPFGVDPGNPDYVIVPDMVDKLVKISEDGGTTWTPDSIISFLVTGNGEYKFNWDQFSQVSALAVNPDCPNQILVGTQEVGIFVTYNRGKTWGRVFGTEVIPFVSSFFFAHDGEVIVSSYGRSLWKLHLPCHGKPEFPSSQKIIAGPSLYDRGTKIPLNSIHDPASTPKFGWFLLKGGEILDYSLQSETGLVQEVVISGGEFQGVTWDGKPLETPFRIAQGKDKGQFAGDQGLLAELKGEVRVKGLLLEDKVLRAPLLATQDVTPGQLPQQAPKRPYISIQSQEREGTLVGLFEPIQVKGYHFQPGAPLEIWIDEAPIRLQTQPVIDNTGKFSLSIPQRLEAGGHTLLVSQKSGDQVVRDAESFFIPDHED